MVVRAESKVRLELEGVEARRHAPIAKTTGETADLAQPDLLAALALVEIPAALGPTSLEVSK